MPPFGILTLLPPSRNDAALARRKRTASTTTRIPMLTDRCGPRTADTTITVPTFNASAVFDWWARWANACALGLCRGGLTPRLHNPRSHLQPNTTEQHAQYTRTAQES